MTHTPTYTRGLCVACGNPFTERDWEHRHSDEDGFDIHYQCCDCETGGHGDAPWTPPSPCRLLFLNEHGEHDTGYDPADTILMGTSFEFEEEHGMPSLRAFADLEVDDEIEPAVVAVAEEWRDIGLQIGRAIHDNWDVTTVAAFAHALNMQPADVIRFATHTIDLDAWRDG